MRYLMALSLFLSVGCKEKEREKVLAGTVELKPELKESVKPEDTVFVIARRGTGGPPLAAKKIPATAFPLTFTLTEKDVMMGGPFEGEVELSVRIDKDGDAMTKLPGDLTGKSTKPVTVGDKEIKVLVDTVM
jgi:cytochrome c-type biogenesis protein CcmH